MACLILDDMFPNTISRWRTNEYCHYLTTFDQVDVAVHSFKPFIYHFSQCYQHCKADYPEAFEHRHVQVVNEGVLPAELRAGSIKSELPSDLCDFLWTRSTTPRKLSDYKVIYCIFVNQAWAYYPLAEKYNIPLICECYPGGGYDGRLRAGQLHDLFNRPLFHKVITTQPLVYEELGRFCPASKLEYIYGAVMIAPTTITTSPPYRETFSICYTSAGSAEKKGFDIFTAVVELVAHYPRLQVHVVGGNWDERLRRFPVTYHGVIGDHRRLRALYQEVDLIICPIRHHGERDAFPVGCAIEAGTLGVGVLTTDTYGTNEKTKLFKEGEELVIVPLDPAVIAQRLQTLYDDPHALHALKTNGYRRFNQLFGAEQQLKRRTEIIFHDRLRGELHSLLAQIPSDFGGGATKEKADALLTLALDQQLKTVVEIGVYRGRSLLALALAMTATGGRWLGIDAYCRLVATQQDLVKEKCIRVPGGLEVANQQWLVTTDFEGLSRQVQQLLARVAGEYGRLLRMPTSEAVAILQAEDYVIDLLHIDGNHDTTEVLRDISHYLPLVRSGGYVVMNATNFSSVQRALPALTTVQCVRLQDHGLWQLWRKP